MPELRSRGASLLVISQQTPANSRRAQRDNALTFPILSDKGGDIGAAFGLRWTVPADMREVQTRLGSALPVLNGEDSWTLPMPARYVIKPDAIIAYAEINPDYTRRPEPGELLPVLEGIRSEVR